MSTIVKMPQLGETVVEGTIARWLKAPGDVVTKLEPLLEISTDKIDTEVPAPVGGILLEIVVNEGETVRAGTTLAYIGAATDQPVSGQADPANGATAPLPAASAPPLVGLAQPIAPTLAKPVGRTFISPVVGRMAAEHQIDLEQITGTGAHGRITKKDLLTFLERARQAAAQPAQSVRPAESAPTSPAAPALTADEILHPLSAMRRLIAQHMVQSKQTSPHVTTVFEVDMTAVVQHRERHKTSYATKGIKLTFTPYFVAAAAAALKKQPQVNSRFSPAGIVQSRRIHIGVAVSLPQGLLVPVVRDADEKNLQGLARAVNEVAEQARKGSLAADVLQGGTFTITNHGVTGSLLGTPIINQPQAAILGIGAIVKRPVVRSSSTSLLPSADDAIVIRPMCYLSFSFDHRVLDGAEADAFLMVIKDRLENWPLEQD